MNKIEVNVSDLQVDVSKNINNQFIIPFQTLLLFSFKSHLYWLAQLDPEEFSAPCLGEYLYAIPSFLCPHSSSFSIPILPLSCRFCPAASSALFEIATMFCAYVPWYWTLFYFSPSYLTLSWKCLAHFLGVLFFQPSTINSGGFSCMRFYKFVLLASWFTFQKEMIVVADFLSVV